MKLEIFQNGQLLQEIPLQSDDMWVGRDEACVIRLDDRQISRKHALLRSTDKGVEFEKKSKFGWIKLNGTETTQAMLRDGDRLELGSFEIRVSGSANQAKPEVIEPSHTVKLNPEVLTQLPAELLELNPPASEADVPVEEAPAEPVSENGGMNFDFSTPSVESNASNAFDDPPQSTSSIDPAAVSNDGATRIFNAPGKIKAILQFGEGAANVDQYEIGDQEIAIGRSQQCHVVLEDKRSSRKHALIKRDGLRFMLKDLGSANGTLVNGLRVDEHELQSGDQLQIGDTIFTFQQLQADYEAKKDEFIQVPQHEAAAVATPIHTDLASSMSHLPSYAPDPFSNEPLQTPLHNEPIQPSFGNPEPEKKKSIIGKFLDRYRAMNTKQQIIYGAVILVCVWFLLEDDGAVQKAKLNTGVQQKKAQKKDDGKKLGVGASFESLTPEQQRYIETQYQLAFDLYKNREYDKSLLEVSKIFSLVQDYRNGREIEAFAREGKRALEAKEEERKRKESERQAQLKLQSLVEQAGLLMDQKRFSDAEALFPEIELIQPENAAVNEWRKRIVGEVERLAEEKAEKKRSEDLHRKAWGDYQRALDLAKDNHYYDALDWFDDILERPLTDQKLIQSVKDDTKRVEDLITSEREPLLIKGKELEGEGKLSEAYKMYEKAVELDPLDKVGPEGLKRIRGTLTLKAKQIYTEGVFAESFSDLDTAEKKFREVLEVVPKEDSYYSKAQGRLKKLTIFKRPVGE